jgi:hypothetical protein
VTGTYKAIFEASKKPTGTKELEFIRGQWQDFMNKRADGKWTNLWADASLAAEAFKLLGLDVPTTTAPPMAPPEDVPA